MDPNKTAESELRARFNEATETGQISRDGPGLLDRVLALFNIDENHNDDDDYELQKKIVENPVSPAYHEVTTAYPSTIGIFASPLPVPNGSNATGTRKKGTAERMKC